MKRRHTAYCARMLPARKRARLAMWRGPSVLSGANSTDADLQRAEDACIHYDRPIRIREMLNAVGTEAVTTNDANLSLAISFCGIACENPFFLASSAVCTNYDMVARAFDVATLRCREE